MRTEQKAGVGRYRLVIRRHNGQITVYRSNNRKTARRNAAGKKAAGINHPAVSQQRLSPSIIPH